MSGRVGKKWYMSAATGVPGNHRCTGINGILTASTASKPHPSTVWWPPVEHLAQPPTPNKVEPTARLLFYRQSMSKTKSSHWVSLSITFH